MVEVIPPAEEAHVSFSAARGRDQEGDAVTIEICDLETLMQRIGVAAVDVLKMDIEGFEYGVVDHLVASPIRPTQLLIEFHHRMYVYAAEDTRRAVERLRTEIVLARMTSPRGKGGPGVRDSRRRTVCCN